MKKIALLLALALPFSANASDAEEFSLVIKNHKFSPEVIEVPAGKRLVIVVDNQDATPEEFESHSLKREKIIAGNSSAKVRIGALEPGEYKFFGEFHEATAQGKLVAK